MAMLTKPITEKVMAPIDSMRSYRDDKITKYEEEADKGVMPPNIDKDIKKMQKIKDFAEKIPPLLRTIENTILAIETAKRIAEAARDAGIIGSALVPPAAAAGVLQNKIIEKVKEELSAAKAELPFVKILIDELKKTAFAIILALLAIKLTAAKKGGGSGDESLDDIQDDLDSAMEEANVDGDGEDLLGGTGVERITRTTTVSGTTTSGGVGGGSSGGGGSGGGGGGY